MKTKLMTNRTIISGKYVEISSYMRPVAYNFSVVNRIQSPRKALVRRSDNIDRAKKRILRITMANELRFKPTFITLTYTHTMLDRNIAVRDTGAFLRRVRLAYPMAQYVYTLERQKLRGEKEGNSGTWHAHVLLFNVPFIPFTTFNKWWKLGNTKINKTNNALHCAFYLAKYIGKDTDDLEGNKRAYNGSHGLLKPQSFRYVVASVVGQTMELTSETIRSNVLGNIILTRTYYGYNNPSQTRSGT